ncbi:13560_t:CDS:2, partial [Funneliformis geosporum]
MVTLQEYLNQQYPTKQDKEGVKKINFYEIYRKDEQKFFTSILIRSIGKMNKNFNLEGEELDLREFKNLEYLKVGKLLLTKLDVGGLVNLKELFCSMNTLTYLDLNGCANLETLSCGDNYLTSIDFLNQLPNPEKLENLVIYDNNIQPTDIEIFSKFVNLRYLKIGNMEISSSLKYIHRNKFYGSLKSYQNLTKLERICIEATDVNEGLEYLPEINKKYPNLTKQIQELSQKITQTQTELTQTKQNEADKTKKIEKLKEKLNYQLSWKTKLKHIIIGSLLAWGEAIYQNIPFNKPEYNNLTNLFRFPQTEKELKSLAKIKQILFPLPVNNPNLESEIMDLKIRDLTIQIPNKKSELAEAINILKNKLSKSEKYLFEKLLTENYNSAELKESMVVEYAKRRLRKGVARRNKETVKIVKEGTKNIRNQLSNFVDVFEPNELEEINNLIDCLEEDEVEAVLLNIFSQPTISGYFLGCITEKIDDFNKGYSSVLTSDDREILKGAYIKSFGHIDSLNNEKDKAFFNIFSKHKSEKEKRHFIKNTIEKLKDWDLLNQVEKKKIIEVIQGAEFTVENSKNLKEIIIKQ